jgi:hypothetical protein
MRVNRLKTLLATVFVVGIGIWLLVGSEFDGALAQSEPGDIKFDYDPKLELILLESTIRTNQQGHVQVVVVNPGLNDYSLVGNVKVTLPDFIHARRANCGPSGGGTIVNMDYPRSNPIKPGEARPCDVWLQARPNSEDRIVKVEAVLDAFPYDPATKQENKNNAVKKIRLRFAFVESGTLERCFKSESTDCNPWSSIDDCDQVLCKPWGKFLGVYFSIATALTAVVIIRSVVTKF